jgi:hypothetical protein
MSFPCIVFVHFGLTTFGAFRIGIPCLPMFTNTHFVLLFPCNLPFIQYLQLSRGAFFKCTTEVQRQRFLFRGYGTSDLARFWHWLLVASKLTGLAVATLQNWNFFSLVKLGKSKQ